MDKLIFTLKADNTSTSYEVERDLFSAGDFFEAALEFYATLGYTTSVKVEVGDPNTIFPVDKIEFDNQNYIHRDNGLDSFLRDDFLKDYVEKIRSTGSHQEDA